MIRNSYKNLSKFFIPLIKRKVNYKILGNFLENLIFDGNSTGADLTKIVKIFMERFHIRYFLKLIFDGNSTGADLTKIVKILYYLK